MKNEIKNTLNIYDINVDRFINICAMVACPEPVDFRVNSNHCQLCYIFVLYQMCPPIEGVTLWFRERQCTITLYLSVLIVKFYSRMQFINVDAR
jgi:hypothetical protein